MSNPIKLNIFFVCSSVAMVAHIQIGAKEGGTVADYQKQINQQSESPQKLPSRALYQLKTQNPLAFQVLMVYGPLCPTDIGFDSLQILLEFLGVPPQKTSAKAIELLIYLLAVLQ